MKKIQIQHSLLLLLTAVIWGTAFVAQSVGMDYVGPFTFLCTRSLIGGVALLPVIAFMDRQKSKEARLEEKKPENKKILIKGGILCGLALCFASAFQQYGLLFTTVGKAGFITAFYIVIVPVVYLCSALTAQVVEWGRMGLTWLLNRMFPHAGFR